jgi:hypothetical protein
VIRVINETVNAYVIVVANPDDKSALGRSGNRREKVILKWTSKSKAEVAVWRLCEGRKWNGIP